MSVKTDDPAPTSVLEPFGDQLSSCGYCHAEPESSHAYGVWAHRLTPELMIDRGWRRSGSYVYLPDRAQTCCPPYSIRCSASGFQASRSQRQAAYRWKKFIEGEAANPSVGSNQDHKPKAPFDLVKVFDAVEHTERSNSIKREHQFEIKLEPAEFTEEKFALYKRYQIEVHNDEPEKVTKKSFDNFLCSNPFPSDTSVAKHACWFLDEKLIAISVIDILPLGISSVYLVWDPDYSRHGLGRLSALREIGWVKDWNRSKFDHRFDWYYLGYYIHSCPKMKYKGEYSPSFLLDPLTFGWKSLEDCVSIIDKSQKNVITFETEPSSDKRPSQKNEAFVIRLLDFKGEVVNIQSTESSIRNEAEKLGPEILKDSLIIF